MTRILGVCLLGLVGFAIISASPSKPSPVGRVVEAQVRDEQTIRDMRRLVRRVAASRNRYRQGWLKRGRTLSRERRLTRLRFYSGVTHAMRLASVSFGVPYSELRAVGSCESGLYPFARNGPYRGIMQEGPMFEAGPFGRAGFSVWDVYANVFTAAYTVSRQGWRQWECKP